MQNAQKYTAYTMGKVMKCIKIAKNSYEEFLVLL